MLIRPTSQGRAVLQLVLDRLHPQVWRAFSTSGVVTARADPEAHRQQILLDRRARRALQEDITKLSSRADIDKRHTGPTLPVLTSSWANVTVGQSSSPWKKTATRGPPKIFKRYDDQRVSQDTRSSRPMYSTKQKRDRKALRLQQSYMDGTSDIVNPSSPNGSTSSGSSPSQRDTPPHALASGNRRNAAPESQISSQRQYHTSHSQLSQQDKRAAARSTRLLWVQRMEALHLTSTPGAPASPSHLSERELEEGEEFHEDISVDSEEAKHGANGDSESIPGEAYDHADVDEVASSPKKDKTLVMESILRGSLSSAEVKIEEVIPNREMIIPSLASPLARVLFSPGVHPMRDPRTGVWNFPHNYSTISQPHEFALDRTPPYIVPSEDKELAELAEREKCRYIGSTSTLTKALSHIYFAISGKGVDLSSFTQDFNSERSDFTAGAEIPAALIITRGKNGTIAVDSDKSFDAENVLSDFDIWARQLDRRHLDLGAYEQGRILEKRLTTTPQDFAKYLRRHADPTQTQDDGKEAYRYRKSGSLLMRSQLDCQDPRLPGTGVFDIKTRAVFPIRHDRANYQANSAYHISKRLGLKGSFEKELYDLLRAGMLKFSMQVRIGDMDGIFVAYHNTKHLLGFQYLPLSEIDTMLFGSSELGDQAFRLSVGMFERIMDQIMRDHPSDRLEVVMRQTSRGKINIFVSPNSTPSDHSADKVKSTTMYILQVRSTLNGVEVEGPIEFPSEQSESITPPEWKVSYTLSRSASDSTSSTEATAALSRALKYITGMNTLAVPDGKTVGEMQERDKLAARSARAAALKNRSASTSETNETGTGAGANELARIRWKEPDGRVLRIREEAAQSGREYEARKKMWKNIARNSHAG